LLYLTKILVVLIICSSCSLAFLLLVRSLTSLFSSLLWRCGCRSCSSRVSFISTKLLVELLRETSETHCAACCYYKHNQDHRRTYVAPSLRPITRATSLKLISGLPKVRHASRSLISSSGFFDFGGMIAKCSSWDLWMCCCVCGIMVQRIGTVVRNAGRILYSRRLVGGNIPGVLAEILDGQLVRSQKRLGTLTSA
jgi:hypothetical protein